jgi:hypothetical protein
MQANEQANKQANIKQTNKQAKTAGRCGRAAIVLVAHGPRADTHTYRRPHTCTHAHTHARACTYSHTQAHKCASGIVARCNARVCCNSSHPAPTRRSRWKRCRHFRPQPGSSTRSGYSIAVLDGELDRGTRSRYSTGYSIAVLDRGTRRTRRCRLVVHSPPECSQPCCTPPPALQSLRIRDRAHEQAKAKDIAFRGDVQYSQYTAAACRAAGSARPQDRLRRLGCASHRPSPRAQAAAQRNPIPPSRERVAGGRRCSAANARVQRGASRNHEKRVSWVPHLRLRLQQATLRMRVPFLAAQARTKGCTRSSPLLQVERSALRA